MEVRCDQVTISGSMIWRDGATEGSASLFVLRCKLFYKKENEFKEKGVGTLHLKPTANQKTQLLVRADTNLGE